MICNVNNGIITFSDSEIKGLPLSDLFNVYVGLVSGKDEVYRVPFGNISILNDKNRVDKYIYTETYPTKDTQIDSHLLANKEILLARRIKKFSETNWFQWGAQRNVKAIEANLGKPCIYVKNMTRSSEIAFIDKVQNFGGSLLCLIPKKEMDLQKIINILNSKDLQKDYMYSGRFKIGHKQVCNIILPL
jgi:adenine-specific DNA-methyltransferase